LGAALRQLRDSKGLSSEEVAEQLGWSASKISRIETARIGVRVSDVRLLLELYGVEEHQRGELLALAHDAGKRGWWENYPGLRPDYAAFIAFEDEADGVLQYETGVVPGLMQTEEYARHVILGTNAFAVNAPRAIDRLVEVRVRRQRMLYPPRNTRLSVVLDESVLLRRVGDDKVMARQLLHMIEMMQLPNVILQVLPLNGKHFPVLGASFTLLEFSSSYDVLFPDMVNIESVTAMQSQDEKVTHEYRLAYENLVEQTVDPVQSEALIRQLATDRWRVS
jgi:transcriptional regulator with XRE-family HTH domain